MPQPSDRFHVWFLKGVFVSLLFLGIGFVYWAKIAVHDAVEQARNEPSLFVDGGGGPNYCYHSVKVSGKGQGKVSGRLRHHLENVVSSGVPFATSSEPRINFGLSIKFRSPDLKLDRNAAEPLARYKHIMSLSVEGAEIDEDAFQIICDLGNVENLDLSNCTLPPDAWEQLSQCENLAELRLNRSSITYEDVGKIRRALPGCKVYW